LRNVLAPGYDVIDHARIWQIIQDNLPALRTEAADLIEESERAAPPTLPSR
jgi:uncharacterized protein with HEPN domain